MKKSSTKYDVLSPDGFSIHPTDTYSSVKSAEKAFDEWKQRYKHQGYYSSVKYGRIPLPELKRYVDIVKL
jgi:hypothetical protein